MDVVQVANEVGASLVPVMVRDDAEPSEAEIAAPFPELSLIFSKVQLVTVSAVADDSIMIKGFERATRASLWTRVQTTLVSESDPLWTPNRLLTRSMERRVKEREINETTDGETESSMLM